ncbi:putative defense protein [Physella acuta]|uniref:putative defense protein n=1 Tax=Physella acuta TaxID=109671 RepID=UPI0027DE6646|nr:putative defense protein [Physella acuta]
MRCRVILLALAVWVGPGSCYPNGQGVDSSCATLVPGHGVTPQASTPPYYLTITPTSYTPDQPVTVTLGGNPNTFKGFMIQARRADGLSSELLGYFSTDMGTRQACNGRALVHSDNSSKANKTFNWIPPKYSVGNVVFRVTIVQNVRTFWADSSSVVLVPAGQPTYPVTQRLTSNPTTATWRPPTTPRKVTHPYVCVGGDCDCETLACDVGVSWHKTGCLLAAILAILSVVYVW